MMHPAAWDWRRAVAALLVVALMLAGVGRAVASIVPAAAFPPGLDAPICHSGGGEAPADPAAPPHDCCDACALLAPAVLPAAPAMAAPAAVSHPIARGVTTASIPTLPRQRGPRQSQGPPVA